MRGCHGEPQRCLATHGAAVPRAACVAAEAILVAARYESLHEGDGEQWFKETCRGEAAVFDFFIAALEARDLRKQGYALKARLRRMSKRALNRD